MARVTKKFVDSRPFVEKGQTLYWDTELRGFALCVGRTSKSYIAQRDLNGRTVRITIGKHGVFTPEQARLHARDLLNRMARGEDPRITKKVERANAFTLREAWAEYGRARKLTKQSRTAYDSVVSHHLADWADRPLSQITGAMVVERSTELAAKIGRSSGARAMRIFRAIYNFALVVRPELPPNPTARLSQLRLWYRDRRRQSYVSPSNLPAWYAAVRASPNAAARDYLLLLLFTGMRRSEAARLRWEHIDLGARTLTVPETKNGDPLVLPLSDFVFELLRERRRHIQVSPWVFPADSRSGHLQEPKKWAAAVSRSSGVQFTLHDLRRTFITVAEGLDFSAYALKRLLNHREGGRDVTAGYVVLDVERLRKPMERISGRLLQLCDADEASARMIR